MTIMMKLDATDLQIDEVEQKARERGFRVQHTKGSTMIFVFIGDYGAEVLPDPEAFRGMDGVTNVLTGRVNVPPKATPMFESGLSSQARASA